MSRPGPALEFQCQGLAPGQGSVPALEFKRQVPARGFEWQRPSSGLVKDQDLSVKDDDNDED